MAVLVNLASNQYTPQTRNFPFTIPVGAKEIRFTLTREAWPGTVADVVARVRIRWSDGSEGVAEFPGGTAIGRDGSVSTKSSVGVPVPDGVTNQATCIAEVLQTISTAVTVESR